jgi:hypothetical protein
MEDSEVDPETGFLIDPLPAWYFSKNQLPSPNPRAIQGRREASSSDASRKGKEKEEEEESRAEVNGDGQSIFGFLDFGQRVKARWSDGKYYEATVCRIIPEKNTVQVVYDDGFTQVCRSV